MWELEFGAPSRSQVQIIHHTGIPQITQLPFVYYSQQKQHPALLQVTTFQILKEGYHVPSQPPFLQAEHSQVPQPIFIGLGPLAPDHPRRSTLYPFNFIDVLLEVRPP
ncbi:uncharacterized protein LOC143841025 [Paroedura picta]|uniref:uncharacterized protein LOC143841025 n=1 Tax=Paroedura picta TaxID=143630 RepID=UPI0040569D2B